MWSVEWSKQTKHPQTTTAKTNTNQTNEQQQKYDQ